MRFQNKQHNDAEYGASLDLTPMIDILFILIIFFMLTIGSQLQALVVDIPENKHTETTFEDDGNFKIIVEIQNDKYSINEIIMDNLEAAKAEINNLVSQYPNYRLLIAPQQDATVQPFIDILTFLSEQKIKNEILLEPKNDEETSTN
ncbi:MAG: biopolymer transporter ExbD [Alphaproteobacteria bacterium]